MVDGKYIVVPLAADGKIAIGPDKRTVGVRVRLIGTLYHEVIMDATRPMFELVAEAKSRLAPHLPKAESLTGFSVRDLSGPAR